MDKITAYRNKHPRCRYCKYHEIKWTPVLLTCPTVRIDICQLKKKDIANIRIKRIGLTGKFCKGFEPEKRVDEI